MLIKIGERSLTNFGRPYFIADIAANHDGDINRAYALIELAKESGADAVKFQNFKAETIVSKNGFDSLNTKLSHQAGWQKSVFEVYKDASISPDWTQLLKKKCDSVGIEYMTSPYDIQFIDDVEPYLNAYKIGSGDITWLGILEHIARKNKPVVLSTGASTLDDVKRAVAVIEKHTKQIILLQCNTNYTAERKNFNNINLNVLRTYSKEFPDYILGLSDHTLGHSTVLGAIALGAVVIEKHFTDDNNRVGPDHKFSMTPSTWREMVDRSMEVYCALGDGIKRIEDNEQDTCIVQRRALYTTRDLKKGDVIKESDMFPLRPAKNGSILPYDALKVIGEKINKDIAKDSCLLWEDIVNDKG